MFLLLTFTASSKDSFDFKQVNLSLVLKSVVFYIWDHVIKLVVDEHLFGGWLLREVSKYRVFSARNFPVFSSNTGK